MKKNTYIIFALLSIFLCHQAKAQLTGWPTSSTNFVVADGEIVKFDDTRT